MKDNHMIHTLYLMDGNFPNKCLRLSLVWLPNCNFYVTLHILALTEENSAWKN